MSSASVQDRTEKSVSGESGRATERQQLASTGSIYSLSVHVLSWAAVAFDIIVIQLNSDLLCWRCYENAAVKSSKIAFVTFM